VQVAVREQDEAAVLRLRVLARLFLADERVLVLRLGLKDDAGEALVVEEQEVDEAAAGPFEVVAEGVEVALLQLAVRLQADVRRLAVFLEEAPAGSL